MIWCNGRSVSLASHNRMHHILAGAATMTMSLAWNPMIESNLLHNRVAREACTDRAKPLPAATTRRTARWKGGGGGPPSRSAESGHPSSDAFQGVRFSPRAQFAHNKGHRPYSASPWTLAYLRTFLLRGMEGRLRERARTVQALRSLTPRTLAHGHSPIHSPSCHQPTRGVGVLPSNRLHLLTMSFDDMS